MVYVGRTAGDGGVVVMVVVVQADAGVGGGVGEVRVVGVVVMLTGGKNEVGWRGV